MMYIQVVLEFLSAAEDLKKIGDVNVEPRPGPSRIWKMKDKNQKSEGYSSKRSSQY